MKTIKMVQLVVALVLFISLTASKSYMKPSFVGKWRIDTLKSDFGGIPVNKASAKQILVTQTNTEVTFDRTFQNAPISSKETLKLDGTELEVKQDDFTAIRTLRLSEDKLVLTVSSKYHVTQEGQEPWEYTRVETYALGKDEKSLFLTRVSTLPEGKEEIVKAHYDRVD